MTVSNGDTCSKCNIKGQITEIGAASGRPHYHCSQCGVTWWGKNPYAVAYGALGGKARAKALSPEERTRIAEKAGNAFAQKMREKRLRSRR